MNISDITRAGKEMIYLASQYSRMPNREMLLDSALFGFLRGKHGTVERQHPVRVYGGTKPKRIDYRKGGTNPTVLEFAVRSPMGGGTLLGSQNSSELRKLCRVSATEARLRALLLLDLYHEPQDLAALWRTYDNVSSMPGRYKRSGVRVIYVHAEVQGAYLWRPWIA